MTGEQESPRWSTLRQAEMPEFDLRLYRERAGLDLPEALRWWEHHVLSGEAARAIAAGWTLDDVVRARAASMTVGDAIDYGERSGLPAAHVAEWHREGILAEDAAEAVAAGWSLPETIDRQPLLEERRERLAREHRAEIERLEREAAERIRRADELMHAQKLEIEHLERRAEARTLLELSGGAEGVELQFRILELDGIYLAPGLGEFQTLGAALTEIASTTLSLGGVLHRATLTGLDLAGLVTVSECVAPAAERHFPVTTGRHRPMCRDDDDIYDNDIYDDEDVRFDAVHANRLAGAWDQVLVMRKFELDGGVDLVPAVPDAWPGFVRHTETITSVGDVYLLMEPDDPSMVAAVVGRFADPETGLRAAAALRDPSA